MEVKIKSMKYEDFNDNEYLEQLRAAGTTQCGPSPSQPAVAELNLWQWEPPVTILPVLGLK